MAYESIQAILEEAGLSQVVRLETPAGSADGSNRAFTVNHAPLSDANYDGAVDTTDVTLLVNGAAVSVSAIDKDNGIITAAVAPTNGATVAVTYRYSPVPLTLVQKASEEADDVIDEAMQVLDDRPELNATLRKIARWYAAGLLLTREYGFQNATEQTSKDGLKKIEKAEEWLSAYVAMLIEQATHPDQEIALDADSVSSPGVFTRFDETSGVYERGDVTGSSISSLDDLFMRGGDLDT